MLRFFIFEMALFIPQIVIFPSTGNYGRAMETYKEIHHKFPENVDCKLYIITFIPLSKFVEKFSA